MTKVYDKIDLKYVSPREVVVQIKQAFKKYGEENVSFEVTSECEYGDWVGVCYLYCGRNKTLEEIQQEKEQEQKRKEWRKASYLALKKEFENDY